MKVFTIITVCVWILVLTISVFSSERENYTQNGLIYDPSDDVSAMKYSPINTPINRALGDIVDSIPFPSGAGIVNGLAWDNGVLWVSDFTSAYIFKVEGNTGVVLDSFPGPVPGSSGCGELAFDGTYLWNGDYSTDRIYKIDTNTGAVVDSFPDPIGADEGFTFDGTYLWRGSADTLVQVDPSTGLTVSGIPGPGTYCDGLAWDGSTLWFNSNTGVVYQIDPANGSILQSFPEPTPGANENGLAFDGLYLRYDDSSPQLIYSIDIGFVPPPQISVNPTSVDEIVMVNDSMDVAIQISNDAGAGSTLNWSASLTLTSKSKSMQIVLPVSANNHATTKAVPAPITQPVENASVMLGRAPQVIQSEYYTDEPTISLRGVNGPAYGSDAISDQFLKFWLNAPGTTTPQGANTGDLYCGDFDGAGVFYAIDNATSDLVIIDTTNGSGTVVGTVSVQTGHTWTGMSWDASTSTMYASSTDGATSALYTLDLTTPSSTLVGTNTTLTLLIDIAVDPAGQMYGHDLNDNIYLIDKSNFTETLLGATGFDANFAQGMDFNPETGELYLAAYNNGIGAAELRLVNLGNGSTSLVGPIGAGTGVEVCAFGIAGGAASQPWIRLVGSTSGSINPGNSHNLNVRLYGLDIDDTTYTADIEISSNDPSTPVVTVPVTIHVPPVVGIEDPTQTPFTYAISQNYPNPFNPTTAITYQLPVSAKVNITIYNLVGQKVRTLVNELKQPGDYKTEWDGLNDSGIQVATGVYLYRIQAGDFLKSKKMIMLK